MRVGIFFNIQKSSGGGYQYATTMLQALEHIREHVYIVFNTSPDLPEFVRHSPQFSVIETQSLLTPLWNKAGRKVLKKIDQIIHDGLLILQLFKLLNWYDAKTRTRPFQKLIKQYGVEFMVFPSSYTYAAQLSIPTIAPIHDLHHRFSRQFPEVGEGRAYLNKEYLYSQIARKAFRVLVDSQTSKEDVVDTYACPAEKVSVIPILPPQYLAHDMTGGQASSLLKPYNLPEKFLFYPAQLWPHKNHIAILQALSLLRKKGMEIAVVFTGDKKNKFGVLDKLNQYAAEQNLEKQIYYLQYVDNLIISALYKQAQALIMPTFFGPTNIPVLEAWLMQCPVLYSSARGCPEQLGDAGILIDPRSAEDIANKITQIWGNAELKKILVDRGKKRLRLWTFNHLVEALNDIIKNAKKL